MRWGSDKKFPARKLHMKFLSRFLLVVSLRLALTFSIFCFILVIFFSSLNNFLSIYRSLESGSDGVPCFNITCHMKWIDIFGLMEADHKRFPPETPLYISRPSKAIQPQRFAVYGDYFVAIT